MQLSYEETRPGRIILYFHTLVIRSDNASEVRREESLLHYHESNGKRRRQHKEYCCDVEGCMYGKQAGLGNPAAMPRSQQLPRMDDVHCVWLQEENARGKQYRLVAGQ